MRVDFNQMQEMTLPCPHQGTGQMSLRAYVGPVSYTHLDVYKRQAKWSTQAAP